MSSTSLSTAFREEASQMMANWRCKSWELSYAIWLLLSTVAAACSGRSVLAQIIPDGTLGAESSVVTPINPQTERIDGGATRGANLFHSFQEFNIGEGRGAYFANPAAIENIFSRVTGNNPSHLLGTLGVLGDANLFFLNPNGIIFGANARLDMRGSLVTSTASSLMFPDGSQFSATNPQVPPLLTIDVLIQVGLQFEGEEAGAMINAGDLEAGSNLTLVGGTVASTGQLSAPRGEVAVSTVGGMEADGTMAVVQLGEAGQILGQEIQPLAEGSSELETSALSWPELVADGGNKTGLTVNDEGKVELLESGTTVSEGDIAVRQLSARGARLSANQNLILVESQLGTVGDLTLLAQDTVRLRDNIEHPFIATAGGELLVEGNQGVDIFVLNHPDSGLFSGGDMVLRSASQVGGDAHYWSGGSFRIEQLDGSLGDLFSPFDPVIRVSGDVSFDSYTGASLHILAGGSVNIPGTITITGPDTVANSLQEDVTLSDGTTVVAINGNAQPTLDIRAGTIAFAPTGITPVNPPGFSAVPLNTDGTGTSADIKIGTINNLGGVVFLTNQYRSNTSLDGNIEVRNIDVSSGDGNGGNVFIDSRSHTNITGNVISQVNKTGRGKGGNILINTNQLSVSNGAQLRSSNFGQEGDAGDVTINALSSVSFDGSNIFTTVEKEGRGNSGNTVINTDQLSISNGAQLQSSNSGQEGDAGNITINADSSISFDGLGSDVISQVNIDGRGKGGNILINANQLSVSNGAQLRSSNFGQEGDAGDVTINALSSISFDGGDVFTTVEKKGRGNSGNIVINTDQLSLSNGAQLQSSNSGQEGDAGNITINADSSISFDGLGSDVISQVNIDGRGKGGNILINTNQLSISNGAQLRSSNFGQEGDAGDVTINADSSVSFDGGDVFSTAEAGVIGNSGNIIINTARLSVKNGGELRASTFGQGEAGNVLINAHESVLFDGQNSGAFTQVERQSLEGKGGNIEISTDLLEVLNSASLTTSNFGQGKAGNLLINAHQVFLNNQATLRTTVERQTDGEGGDIIINTDRLSVIGNATLLAQTFGQGDAGNVKINASEFILFDAQNQCGLGEDCGAFTKVEMTGVGNGGNIEIKTDSLEILNGSSLTTSTFGKGNAGNLQINASKISVTNRGTLRSTAERGTESEPVEGSGGNIIVNASFLEVVDNAEVLASTLDKGDAGSITVTLNTLEIINGGKLIVDSSGTKIAGSINIGGYFLTLDRGTISAQTLSTDGGNITLEFQDLLLLRNGSQISTTAGNAQAGGDGGNITINTPFIIAIPSENSDIIANAFFGRGGVIRITTQELFGIEFRRQLTPLSDITAFSQQNPELNGVVEINTSGIDSTRGLINLPEDTVNTEISQGCQTVRGKEAVAYFEIGRGGSPPHPEDPLNADTALEDWIEAEPNSENGSDSETTTNSPHPAKTELISPCLAQ
ncbi:MAG: filamentous hemagglutinin N-terminal domain-containing protein [Symploca sp. SIO2E9]|nr:filamentous hemagglutinin N-terminal domain-containing protein [Symploca sp. SIO2E9]